MPTLTQIMIEQAVTGGRGYISGSPQNSQGIDLQIALGSMHAQSLEQSIYESTCENGRELLQEARGYVLNELNLLRRAAYKATFPSMRKALVFEPSDVDRLITNYFSNSVKPGDIEGPSFIMR